MAVLRKHYVFVVVLAVCSFAGYGETPPLSASATVYPTHGLPGVPPALDITVTNVGPSAIQLLSTQLCFSGENVDNGASVSIGCGQAALGDISERNLDSFTRGPIDLKPRRSVRFVLNFETNQAFFSTDLLQPGHYDLTVSLVGVAASPAKLKYVVDQPAPDDADAWRALVAGARLSAPAVTFPYVLDTVLDAASSNPKSMYYGIGKYYREQVTGALSDRNGVSEFQALLSLRLPEGFRAHLEPLLAASYQSLAMSDVRSGLEQVAIADLRRARAMLADLSKSDNPATAVDANHILAEEIYTEEELKRLLRPVPARPVEPIAECITTNPDGTFTAWFGYQNPNSGITAVAVGAANAFSPAPEDRGQPSQFDPGIQKRVFSVTSPSGVAIVWKLQDRQAEASPKTKRCDSHQDQGSRPIASAIPGSGSRTIGRDLRWLHRATPRFRAEEQSTRCGGHYCLL